jgi:Flp pilus assembly protein TadG
MKTPRSNGTSLPRSRAGTAIIEFALGSGILFAMFGGTFGFGYTFLQYNRLQSAVAQGARFASLIPYDSTTIAPSTAFLTAVHNMTLYGSPTAGTSPVVRGLTPGNVSLTVTFTNGVPSAMTVAISGYVIDSVFRKTTLSNKPRVTYPYQGIWTPS